MTQHKLLTITGPSCAGKTTLETMLEKRGYSGLVSFTTRPKRLGEVNGEAYWFLTDKEIDTLEGDGQIAEKVRFGGYNYGLLGSELKTKLKTSDCIAVVEPNGVKQLSIYCKDNNIQHIALYITNPPLVLLGRFLNRFKGDSEASVLTYAERIHNMLKSEQEWIFAHDYDIIYTHFDASYNEMVINHIDSVMRPN